MGAMGASWVALFSGIQNHWLMLSAMFLAAFMLGGCWAALPVPARALEGQ